MDYQHVLCVYILIIINTVLIIMEKKGHLCVFNSKHDYLIELPVYTYGMMFLPTRYTTEEGEDWRVVCVM